MKRWIYILMELRKNRKNNSFSRTLSILHII
jgi:hypothetical protein